MNKRILKFHSDAVYKLGEIIQWGPRQWRITKITSTGFCLIDDAYDYEAEEVER